MDLSSGPTNIVFWLLYNALPFLLSQTCRIIVAASGYFPERVSLKSTVSGLLSWFFSTVPTIAHQLVGSDSGSKGDVPSEVAPPIPDG